MFQCAIALTPLADTLVIVGEFLSWSVDAGFVLALPLNHGDHEPDSVGVSTKDHVAILVAWPWLGGGCLQDKNTCTRTSTEKVGGAHMQRGAGRYVHQIVVEHCMEAIQSKMRVS